MPRPPRLILPGIAVHVIQRGNNRAPCFRDDSDCLIYLGHLRALAQRHRCSVHAYCLMTNHVHLLLTPFHEEACTRLMRDLGQRYVQIFNRRHQRTGTLWEGRFRSCIVESSRYVLACYRYIELNPVRAGMVASPQDYPWSSYAANGVGRTDPLVVPHAEFVALGANDQARRAAYRKMVDQPEDKSLLDAIRKSTNAAYPLASDEFKAKHMAPFGYRTERLKPGPKAGPSADDSQQQQLGL